MLLCGSYHSTALPSPERRCAFARIEHLRRHQAELSQEPAPPKSKSKDVKDDKDDKDIRNRYEDDNPPILVLAVLAVLYVLVWLFLEPSLLEEGKWYFPSSYWRVRTVGREPKRRRLRRRVFSIA